MRSEAVNLDIDPLERRFGVVSKELASCAQHGDYASIISRNSPTPSGCPECAEATRRERDRAEQEANFARIAAERLERRLGSAMIPKRFQGKNFDDYRATTPGQRKNLKACQQYAEQFRKNQEAGRCLLLLGKPGTGKTHLANAIAGHIIVNCGATAVYRTVAGILQHVKGSYDSRSEYTEAEAFSSLIEPSLLIIDEVGATKPTEFEQATLFNIINGRYEDQRPTVVVSNLMPEELPAVLGERCVDRLREGGGIGLVFDWESARKEAKA